LRANSWDQDDEADHKTDRGPDKAKTQLLESAHFVGSSVGGIEAVLSVS
jgi:hypothetical protein